MTQPDHDPLDEYQLARDREKPTSKTYQDKDDNDRSTQLLYNESTNLIAFTINVVSSLNGFESQRYEEAMNCDESQLWRESMKEK